MATIMLNTDECEFERDALMFEKYGEEVMYAEDRKRNKMPRAALSSELEEVADRIEFVLSTAFPQCP